MAVNTEDDVECDDDDWHIITREMSLTREMSIDDDEAPVQYQLTMAKEYIAELEERIKAQDRELRIAQDRARKLATQKRKLRRLARSGDLFRPFSGTNANTESGTDEVSYSTCSSLYK